MGTHAGCVLGLNSRELAASPSPRGTRGCATTCKAETPFPQIPTGATTSPSIARSGRGKGRKKKVWAKHSRNALPAGAGSGARAGRPGRPGRGGAGAGRRGRSPGRALGPARAPAWPSRCLGKPFPAFGAGRNFPGKSRTPRSAVSPGGGGGRGAEPRAAWEGGPRAPRRGGPGGEDKKSPAEPPEVRQGGWGLAGVLEGRGGGRGGADRYVRLARAASAAGSSGGPGGGLTLRGSGAETERREGGGG